MSNIKYRQDIDGIRAIAVLLVVIGHGFPNFLPGGFIGVDIFFVISGYLITTILLNDLDNNKFSIKVFYQRRIKRIFPALSIVLLFTVFLGWYCLFKPEFMALGQHIFASTIFSENLLLWSQSSYFDVSSEKKPTLHLWSLAIEEQFYIFWPLILLAAHKFRLNILWLIFVVGLASFSLNVYDVQFNSTAAYYSPLGRSWELLVGALLAYAELKKITVLENAKNLQSTIGFSLICIGLIFAKPNNFPGAIALLPTVGTFLLISGGHQSWINKNILSLSPMVWIGLISYPLYLWHWPFMSYTHIIFGQLPTVAAIVCIIASIIAAYLTFTIIEKPIRTSGNKWLKVLISLMLIISISGIAIASNIIKARLNAIKVPTSHEWRFLKSITSNFDSIENSTSIYKIYPERERQTLFIGDSHIAQYSERINKLISNDISKGGVTFALGGNCLPVQQVTSVDINRKSCIEMIDNAYHLAQSSKFNTIVIGGAWNVYFSSKDYLYKGENLSESKVKENMLLDIVRNVKKLEKQGKKVILVLDNPFDKRLNTLDWRYRVIPNQIKIDPYETVKVDSNNYKINKDLLLWVEKNHINYINPYNYLCDGDICKFTDKDINLIFKDSGHLNPDWTLNNATYIDEVFK